MIQREYHFNFKSVFLLYSRSTILEQALFSLKQLSLCQFLRLFIFANLTKWIQRKQNVTACPSRFTRSRNAATVSSLRHSSGRAELIVTGLSINPLLSPCGLLSISVSLVNKGLVVEPSFTVYTLLLMSLSCICRTNILWIFPKKNIDYC